MQKVVTTDLDWLFREQPTDDYGIDAQFEVVESNAATGRLLAAQIKSGPSYFRNSRPEGWWFSLDRDDLGYWLEHALPVIVVIYDPDSEAAYWQAVNDRTVVTGSRGGKKILIPQSQQLASMSRPELARVASGKPEELRLRQLRLALPWMNLLRSGRRLLIEAQEWVNKSSGRGDIRIISVDEDNEDAQELGSWFIMVGLRPYEEVLPSLVPWADAVLHEETYDEADYEAWQDECVRYDSEGDRLVSEPYEEWRSGRIVDGILRPFANGAGEVDFWRLELVLNDLGKGFLAVERYLKGDGWILTPRLEDH
ncbi:hypothetical protein K8P10_000801 [Leucobacter sp. Psy1]|nr:hypothetical protein K8P10_000801 [Leucobacter sp. Psy1]